MEENNSIQKDAIVVPRLDWLIGGSRIGSDYNVYTGSLGTDPLLGIFNRKIFNYRIRIEKNPETEEEKIKAFCWFGTKSFKNTGESEIEIKEFSLEEESRELIREWLFENFKK